MRPDEPNSRRSLAHAASSAARMAGSLASDSTYRSNRREAPVAASDSQVARKPANTVETCSLQIGMMIAVRAPARMGWWPTDAADIACGSPRHSTQKPIIAVKKPAETHAKSRPNRPICSMRSHALE